jgi:hypothetical protein
MNPTIANRLEALEGMTLSELRDAYAEVFGETTRSRHRIFLQKRVAWGLQAREEGGLSDRARRRAEELVKETDLRLLAPEGRTEALRFRPSHDRRLPMPGAVLKRAYKGRTVSVTVLDEGFEYGGETYRSLTAVARAVTGSHWNGYLFFGLTRSGDAR